MFSIEFSGAAAKFLKKADKQLAKRIIDKIEELAEDPFPQDVKRVINQKEKIFRIRVGDNRIQYSVLFDKQLLIISDIDKRESAYQ